MTSFDIKFKYNEKDDNNEGILTNWFSSTT